MQKIIIFDFDGVIVGSFATAHTLVNSESRVKITADEYREQFNGNIYASYKKEDDVLKDNTAFFAMYKPAVLNLNVIPGMAEVIRQLATDYTLVIVSSTTEDTITAFLAKHHLEQHFAATLGLETDRNKTKKIQMVFDRFKTDSKHCLFITDTLGDMREAAKKNVPCIGVTWGFQRRSSLEQGNPVGIVEKPEELVKAVSKNIS